MAVRTGIRMVLGFALIAGLAGCSSSVPTIGTVQRMPADILDKTEQQRVIDELNKARAAQQGKPDPAVEETLPDEPGAAPVEKKPDQTA